MPPWGQLLLPLPLPLPLPLALLVLPLLPVHLLRLQHHALCEELGLDHEEECEAGSALHRTAGVAALV